MKKIANYIVSRKWIIVLIFVILAGVSIFTSSIVEINYNISDYLSDSTDTKMAIEIIEDEFGMTGNLQVMLTNIDDDTAKDIAEELKNIENVLNVNFDVYDETYYKDQTALYIILIDGDDYSSTAEQVTKDVKDYISQNYNKYNAYYGGTTIEKQNLKSGITNEIKYILLIALVLVVIILLITSKSWLEPIFLLLVSGIAILINSGTNFIFGEISYITNSIAAILQLALSIDYSIVLLNSYRKECDKGLTNNEAMANAIYYSLKPISASGLTTMAGLLALVFMSFTIGFDIGMVLMKGIVISVITTILLLPCVVLLVDRLFIKAEKKALKLNGKYITKIGIKASRFIVPIAAVCIVFACFVKNDVNYLYAEESNSNKEIINTFGKNNNLVLLFENSDDIYTKEEEFINNISNYKKEDGSNILINYTAYINTVREELTVDKACQKLEISNNEAIQLYCMYHLYNNPDLLKINFDTFIDTAYDLILNDNQVIDLVDSETKNLIIQLKTIIDLLNNENSANDFYSTLNNINLGSVELSSIKQLYGIYGYNLLANKDVDFLIILDFIICASKSNSLVSSMLSSEEITDLITLSEGIKSFNEQMNMPLDKTSFQGMMYQNYGMLLTDYQVDYIYSSYFTMNNLSPIDTIEYVNLMKHLILINILTDEYTIQTIQNYKTTYDMINTSYEYNNFIEALATICYNLTSTLPNINVNSDSIFQIYVMYFDSLSLFDQLKIKGIDFVNFVINQYNSNELIKNQINITEYNSLIDMNSIYNTAIDTILYNYPDLSLRLSDLQKSLVSMNATIEMSSDKISGIFIKYAINNGLNVNDSIMAFELLDFVNENKDSNYLLVNMLDNEKREKISTANDDIIKANDLFTSDRYSRMILSLDVLNDSADGMNFVEYVKIESKKIFGENTHIAGELMSTYDLKESFKLDNVLITIVTIISIFIIVLLVFKSVSLPVVLVIIIQGAIWITCTLAVVTKSEIFFMSYIVSSCILMGATIDYGILMSNSYIEYRYKYDKNEALSKAVEIALPTIFSSGLILIVCGFVIGFISSQTSISTVGKLIGIGTISSVIMIVCVLPSVLYLLDRFIIKFTIRKKSKN
ncbi:MAG: MMPL family transporter [Anaeroplasma sp.]